MSIKHRRWFRLGQRYHLIEVRLGRWVRTFEVAHIVTIYKGQR